MKLTKILFIEGDVTEMDNKCDDCNYEFNKNYEIKCPLCGCKVK